MFSGSPLRWISVRVLFLSPRECWPPTSGAKLRDFHLARGLSRGVDLTYLFFGSREGAVSLAANLPLAKSVHAVSPPSKYSAFKIIRGLIGTYPLPVQNYTSSAMARRLDELVAAEPFDVVHLDSIHLAAYIPFLRHALPQVRVMLDWHNIESELMERFAATTTSTARKAYARVTARQMKQLEQRTLQSCDGHLVCSQRECNLLSVREPLARLAVAPNGVDAASFASLQDGPIQKRLVFVGQMSYHANVEGIIWFVREAWPRIRAIDPQFRLSIVGASPGPSVQVLASEPGVEVTGTVPDVRPFYAGAWAAIVPLLTGGGTRLKILEAMAAGVPVISTALGAEGIPVIDKQNFLLADTPETWSKAADWLQDSSNRSTVVENGRRLAVARFDWSAIGEQVLKLYTAWTSPAT